MARSSIGPGVVLGGLQDADEEQTFGLVDADVFHRINQDLKPPIADVLVQPVRQRICYIGYAYWAIRDKEAADASEQDRPTFQRIKAELSSVLRSARDLEAKLKDLSYGAQGWIHAAEEDVVYELLTSQNPASSFGHGFFRYQDSDGTETTTFLHLQQIIGAVSALGNMVDHTVSSARPADKGGRNRNHAMRHYVANMYDVWTRQLGRDFTFAYRGGILQGEASLFCWRLLALIDPSAKIGEFCTAVRDAVGRARPGRGRRRKSQKPTSS